MASRIGEHEADQYRGGNLARRLDLAPRAERDAEAAVNYMRRCPEIIALLGETPDTQAKFEQWFKGGMEVLEFSADGARAYFALETTKALPVKWPSRMRRSNGSGWRSMKSRMRSLSRASRGSAGE